MNYHGFYLYNNEVYKWSENQGYFLQMTGWEIGADRRKLTCEFDESKLEKMKKNKALALINAKWNSGTRTWCHGNSFYSNEHNADAMWSKIPYHDFKHTYKNRLGEEVSYFNRYKIVWHQGKLYWCDNYANYYPQVQLYEFVDVNKEPRKYIKWTNLKNCRAITNEYTKQII